LGGRRPAAAFSELIQPPPALMAGGVLLSRARTNAPRDSRAVSRTGAMRMRCRPAVSMVPRKTVRSTLHPAPSTGAGPATAAPGIGVLSLSGIRDPVRDAVSVETLTSTDAASSRPRQTGSRHGPTARARRSPGSACQTVAMRIGGIVAALRSRRSETAPVPGHREHIGTPRDGGLTS